MRIWITAMDIMFHVKHFYSALNSAPVKKKHFREISKVPIKSWCAWGDLNPRHTV